MVALLPLAAVHAIGLYGVLNNILSRLRNENSTGRDAAETGRNAGPLAKPGWQCARRHMGR